ncbi:MAG: hypothetical protein ACK5II_02500 [Paracoccus sp. (in: a-proteobacteria)]
MTQSLDEVHKEIMSAADRGFGRNCGKPADGLVLDFFKETVFVDAGLANESIGSTDFDNFLLTLRPDEKYFSDSSTFKAYGGVFNDVATLVRPYVDSVAANILISGLDNELQGFSPSFPSSTVGWILISYAQEFVAVKDFQYVGPLKSRDLFYVLDVGRLPVGFVQRPHGGGVMIY